MLLFFPCPESFTRLGHFLNSEMTVTNFDKGISKAAPAAVHQATWSHPCLTSNQNISCIHPLYQSQWTELNSSSYFLCQLCLPFQFVHTIHAAPTYRYIACCTDTMWVFYLLSEGLPKSRHECWGKVFTRHAAHHHRQSSRAGPIGLLQYSLAQFTAGQVCFIASAVDRVVPVCGLSPASEHPAQIKEMRRIFN